MTGKLFVVGLGPGADDLIPPRALAALSVADDLVGYEPYLRRISHTPTQRVHASDNREEIPRAEMAIDLALSGRQVAMVSGGDPGVFAMAAAVFEALESRDAAERELPVEVIPGISAVLAAAARIGAPCGNDFCVINLSDNLKPFEII
ncbi:MAG: SAM-dependent methyltransferase, partial [Pseudomonadota bacterium]